MPGLYPCANSVKISKVWAYRFPACKIRSAANSAGIDKNSCEAGRKLQNDRMNEYDEFEVIDADTKRRLGRFTDLRSARTMNIGPMASIGRLRYGVLL
jgi:hypothetical protein